MEQEIVKGQEMAKGKIVTVQAVDLSGIFERMGVLEKKVDMLAEMIAELQALTRKQIYMANKDYNDFKEWAKERVKRQYDVITSNDVVAEFGVSKPTALSWMERFARENPRYVLHKPEGKQPYRLALNLVFQRA